MGDSIEQIKEELKYHYTQVIGSKGIEMVDHFASKPGADTLEFWQERKNAIRDLKVKPKETEALCDFEYQESDGTAGVGGIVITKYNKDAPKDVIIPAQIDGKKVTGIGKRAFSRTKLTSLTIPEGVTFIGDNAFSYHELTSVKIPDSVKTIGEDAFRAGHLTSVIIGNGVETICKEAFSCNRISELVLGENLITISEQAFSNNKNLETVVIPDSVQNIGKKAFSEAGIKNLTIGNNVKTIEENAFAKNQIAQIIFGNSLETIGEYAFYENKLTELVIPKSVKSIGDSAFRVNPFKAVVLPENADYGNTTEKIFGARVTYLSEAAHTWEKDNTQYANPDDFKWKKTKDGKAIIIFRYLGKGNEGASLEVSIPPQIQGLPVIEVCFTDGVAFGKRVKIKHVTIPDSVITISNNAFEGHGLESVIIGKGVKNIGERAFQYNQLTEINIPDTVTFIAQEAFYNNKLKHITIPKGITYVAQMSFCTNELTSVTLPEGLITIEYGAFKSNKITSLIIPESLKSIREQAFENNKIKSLILPDRLTHLGDRAFNNNLISSLSIGKGLTRLTYMTFMDNSLKELVIPSNIEYICFGIGARPSYVFRNNNLTSVIFPEGVFVGDDAFIENKLTSVIRPKNALFTGSFDKGVQIIDAPDAKDKHDTHCSPPNFPPKHESLKIRDNELNCSVIINPNAQPRKRPRKEDIVMCLSNALYTDGVVKENGKGYLWKYSANVLNESSTDKIDGVTVTEWEDKALADKDEQEAKAKNNKCIRLGKIVLSCTNNRGIEAFKRAITIMDLSKDEVIAEYTRVNVSNSKSKACQIDRFTIKEVKPAGNWKWELEIENREGIAVIIGWNSMDDADSAEKIYKTNCEIQYIRYGNVTAYVRTSKEILHFNQGIIRNTKSAAGGKYELPDFMKD